MTNNEIAAAHRASLLDLGWACGELIGASFEVTQPARVVGTGRKAKLIPAVRQVRAFEGNGTMVVTTVTII